MKKTLIFILAMASMVAVFAHNKCSGNDSIDTPYKFKKGSVATELNFSPFNLSYNHDDDRVSYGPFSMPELRLRVGLCKNLALRVNVGIDFSYENTKKNIDETQITEWGKTIIKGDRTTKFNRTKFSIAPGIEYHFGKWKRMSVYVGGEVPFELNVSKRVSDDKLTTDFFQIDYSSGGNLMWKHTTTTTSHLEMKNCNYGYSCGPWGCNYEYYQTERMYIGVGLFTGFDFYIYKGLYMGAELGFSYRHSIMLKGTAKGKTTTTTVSETSTAFDESLVDETRKDKITGGNLGFKCNPMIRLGWKF